MCDNKAMNTLTGFGWTDANQSAWSTMKTSNTQPARVVADFGTSLKIATPSIISAELSGKLAYYTDKTDLPKVGDWVSVTISDNNTVVESVIFRSNEISRKVTGKRTVKQVIAANVDIAFVLLALDGDFSVERLKRFLYQLSVSAVQPVIVLNKADKTDDLQSYINQLEQLKLPIVVTIALEGIGVDTILEHIPAGKTAILLGSSGVGKSTLTNKLLGRDIQSTGDVKLSDTTGRHTTVHRELFILPGGGILIDTPGIRELQLWGTNDELDENYDDIALLASQCRYKNCRHGSEDGCAIVRALNDKTLDPKHYANYVKMKNELAILEIKATEKLRQSKRRISRDKKQNTGNNYDRQDEL